MSADPRAVRSGTAWRDRNEFRQRVHEWAQRLEVDAKAVFIRPMRRKWASCSTGGTLSFNDELLDLARELGDYVIVHELLHFSVPNHGRLWKSLMRVHLGDYEALAGGLPTLGRSRASGVRAGGAGGRKSHR